jgi:hypothetical protein
MVLSSAIIQPVDIASGEVLGLLDGIAPSLPGAACRGKHDLFDTAHRDPSARAAALAICADCRCRPAHGALNPASSQVGAVFLLTTSPPIRRKSSLRSNAIRSRGMLCTQQTRER